MRNLYEDTLTLFDVFRRGCRVSNNGPCLGWREGPTKQYQWMRYEEALLRSQNFGSGLVALGLKPSPSTLVGIYSQNCAEWVLSEHGLYSFSMVIVPLYDTLGPEACRYITNQAEMNLVICENDDKVKLLLNKSPACLRMLVHIRPISKDTAALAKSKGIQTWSFEEVEKLGAQKKNKMVPPQPQELCTTGNPKGVMLTHDNVVVDLRDVGHDNGNDARLEALSVKKHLRNVLALAVHVPALDRGNRRVEIAFFQLPKGLQRQIWRFQESKFTLSRAPQANVAGSSTEHKRKWAP